jgi:hypothetical protein
MLDFQAMNAYHMFAAKFKRAGKWHVCFQITDDATALKLYHKCVTSQVSNTSTILAVKNVRFITSCEAWSYKHVLAQIMHAHMTWQFQSSPTFSLCPVMHAHMTW